MRKLLLAGGLTLGVFVTGCGAEARQSTQTPQPTATRNSAVSSTTPLMSTTPTTSGGMAVALGQTRYGKALVSGTGRVLYLFEKDKRNKSSCYGPCAKAWPPYVPDGQMRTGSGVRAELLGTIRRDDGTTQVSYNGHPLYYYIKDRNAGDVTGQNLKDYGADWYVVGANGTKVPGQHR
jgi:predicted lipoprotein with Yx(FWY)xxD motif